MVIITVARKPLDGTVARNALKWGTGGINVDASRIGHTEDFSDIKSRSAMKLNSSGATHNPDAPSVVEAQAKLQSLGRWPANMILSHLPGCVCTGSIQIKGNRTDTRPEGDGGRADKDQWRFRPTGATKRGYSDDTGKEAIPAWQCEAGCPVAALDAQSGTVPTGSWNRQTDTAHPFGNAKDTPYETWQAVKEPAGGASRFFKQVKP